ncbi:MAG TPA: hypothetical protein VEP90_03370 [Methylomirabilota bacterium]|nr:hypothetical protein [Methylomirabilota bacterium]
MSKETHEKNDQIDAYRRHVHWFLAGLAVFLILTSFIPLVFASVVFCLTKSPSSFLLLTGSSIPWIAAISLLRRLYRYHLPLSGDEALIELVNILYSRYRRPKVIAQTIPFSLIHSSEEKSDMSHVQM